MKMIKRRSASDVLQTKIDRSIKKFIFCTSKRREINNNSIAAEG